MDAFGSVMIVGLLGIPVVDQLVRWRARRRFFAANMAGIDPSWLALYRTRLNKRLWPSITDVSIESYQASFDRVLDVLEGVGVSLEGEVTMTHSQAQAFFGLCFHGQRVYSYDVPEWDGLQHRVTYVDHRVVEMLVASFLFEKDKTLRSKWVAVFAWGIQQGLSHQRATTALREVERWAGIISGERSRLLEELRAGMYQPVQEMIYATNRASRPRSR